MPTIAERRIVARAALAAALALGIGAARAQAAPPVTLTVFAAGTLAAAFDKLDAAFERRYPNVTVQPQFGGSVKMVKQVTQLHEVADVVATADASVIPKFMFAHGGGKAYADWYIGFLTNAMTFVYTPKSKYANQIDASNWYRVLSRPGVAIGRSDPNTDPSGYQALQMIELASRYYHDPGLTKKILANAPPANMRDTETELLPALSSGQIDYLAIYRSEALRLHLRYLHLPPQVDLSDGRYAALYRGVSVRTANGEVRGAPIIYAVTVPSNAAHAAVARAYVAMLLGPVGQKILDQAGFSAVHPGYASDPQRVPATLRSLVRSWPNP